MKSLVTLFFIFIYSISYTQSTEEVIQNIQLDLEIMSEDHSHLRGNIFMMFKESNINGLLEIFNSNGFSRSVKYLYQESNKWYGTHEIETEEFFVSFIKEIIDEIPADLEPFLPEVEEEIIIDHSIIETWKYTNTKGERVELSVQFYNHQINLIWYVIYR